MLTQLNPQLQQRLGLSTSEITTFCQRWQITELSLFGSVLGNQFHPDSDIDILIRLAPNTRQGLLTLAKIKHRAARCARPSRIPADLLHIDGGGLRELAEKIHQVAQGLGHVFEFNCRKMTAERKTARFPWVDGDDHAALSSLRI